MFKIIIVQVIISWVEREWTVVRVIFMQVVTNFCSRHNHQGDGTCFHSNYHLVHCETFSSSSVLALLCIYSHCCVLFKCKRWCCSLNSFGCFKCCVIPGLQKNQLNYYYTDMLCSGPMVIEVMYLVD